MGLRHGRGLWEDRVVRGLAGFDPARTEVRRRQWSRRDLPRAEAEHMHLAVPVDDHTGWVDEHQGIGTAGSRAMLSNY